MKFIVVQVSERLFYIAELAHDRRTYRAVAAVKARWVANNLCEILNTNSAKALPDAKA